MTNQMWILIAIACAVTACFFHVGAGMLAYLSPTDQRDAATFNITGFTLSGICATILFLVWMSQ